MIAIEILFPIFRSPAHVYIFIFCRQMQPFITAARKILESGSKADQVEKLQCLRMYVRTLEGHRSNK